MAAPRQISVSHPARQRRSIKALLAGLTAGGTDGNERLTAAAGGVLIVLLAVIGATIISLRPLLSVHLFVGMLLIGPVALKLASTGYRFARYYTADQSYRRKGPPPIALRLIAPVVVLSTVVVFASGVALLFAGPQSREALLPVHKISFIVWLVFTSLHVLAHLPTLTQALRADFGRSTRSGVLATAAPFGGYAAGRSGRVLSLAGALTAGLVLAIFTVPQFTPWLHAHFHHH